jgi:hypothetical protein
MRVLEREFTPLVTGHGPLVSQICRRSPGRRHESLPLDFCLAIKRSINLGPSVKLKRRSDRGYRSRVMPDPARSMAVTSDDRIRVLPSCL